MSKVIENKFNIVNLEINVGCRRIPPGNCLLRVARRLLIRAGGCGVWDLVVSGGCGVKCGCCWAGPGTRVGAGAGRWWLLIVASGNGSQPMCGAGLGWLVIRDVCLG